MACGCGNKMGLTPEKALIFGDDQGEEPIQVVATVSVAQQPAGRTFWAKGNQLQTMFDAGWITPAS